MHKPKPESFEKFYYTKVGLGEGCGCAERVIDVYEFNRLAGQVPPGTRPNGFGFIPFFRRIARKLGLSARRD